VERVLLVIDVQNDFCRGGSLEVPGGEQVVPVINLLTRRFRRIVATQDWHPPGHVSFASSHPGARPFQELELAGGLRQTVWPEHCLAGSRGAELHPGLEAAPLTLLVRKGARRELDSYSAFFENDRRTPTGLIGWLRELGAGEVFLSGLATDVCVYYSALDAVRLGLGVCLVQDACRGIDSPAGSLAARLDELRSSGVRLLSSTEV